MSDMLGGPDDAFDADELGGCVGILLGLAVTAGVALAVWAALQWIGAW